MKRVAIGAAMISVLGALALSYVTAGGPRHHRGMMGGPGMMYSDSMWSGHMRGSGMMGMGMMGGMMMPRQIVALDDGIVVALGNKLVKYDKNLNRKKEITLELDDEAFKDMVEHMERMHSTYWGMMEPASKKEK